MIRAYCRNIYTVPGYHILANDDRSYKGFAIFHCFLAEKCKEKYGYFLEKKQIKKIILKIDK